MEWLVEKLTEIGVDRISLFFSQNSERRKYRIDRLEKKIISAMKQSKNPFIPQLNNPVKFSGLLSGCSEEQKFIAFVDQQNSHMLYDLAEKNRSVLVLIGPEGDFTSAEVSEAEKAGFRKISLGRNILRTETAALMSCHTIHLINS